MGRTVTQGCTIPAMSGAAILDRPFETTAATPSKGLSLEERIAAKHARQREVQVHPRLAGSELLLSEDEITALKILDAI